MLSHRCAFCGNQTHFTARHGQIFDREVEGGKYSHRAKLEVAATCDACTRFNVATGTLPWRHTNHSLDDYPSGSTLTKEAEAMEDVTWSPPSMVQADTEYIPNEIAGFYQEAHDAFSIGAFRAVLLLSRSVIEATAKVNDAGGNNLVAKIDSLHQEGIIRPGTKKVAHALRILGNDMAHGDLDATPTQEDAEDVLRLVRMVLDDVYVGEAMTADILTRRGKNAN